MHPATNDVGHKLSAFNNVLSYFKTQLEDIETRNKRLRMRLASSSEDDSDDQHHDGDEEQVDDTKDAGSEVVIEKDPDDKIIPAGIEAQVDKLIQELNNAYITIPDKVNRTRVRVHIDKKGLPHAAEVPNVDK